MNWKEKNVSRYITLSSLIFTATDHRSFEHKSISSCWCSNWGSYITLAFRDSTLFVCFIPLEIWLLHLLGFSLMYMRMVGSLDCSRSPSGYLDVHEHEHTHNSDGGHVELIQLAYNPCRVLLCTRSLQSELGLCAWALFVFYTAGNIYILRHSAIIEIKLFITNEAITSIFPFLFPLYVNVLIV